MKYHFLAVQDSSIGDLVTHSLIKWLTFDFRGIRAMQSCCYKDYNDYNDYKDYKAYNDYNDYNDYIDYNDYKETND